MLWCVSVHVCVHVHIIQSVDLSEIPNIISNQFVPCASPIGSASWKVSDVDMCMCMCMCSCVKVCLCASHDAAMQMIRYTWVSVAKDKANQSVADSLGSVPQESWS